MKVRFLVLGLIWLAFAVYATSVAVRRNHPLYYGLLAVAIGLAIANLVRAFRS